MSDSTPEPLRLAPDVVERGLRQVQRIRAQLAGHRPDLVVAPPPRQEERSVGDDVFEPAIMAQLMASGAERDRLRQRVDELEAEVARLRAALGRIVRVVGDELDRDAR